MSILGFGRPSKKKVEAALEVASDPVEPDAEAKAQAEKAEADRKADAEALAREVKARQDAESETVAMDAMTENSRGLPRPHGHKPNGEKVSLTREFLKRAGARGPRGEELHPEDACDLKRVKLWQDQLNRWEIGVFE